MVNQFHLLLRSLPDVVAEIISNQGSGNRDRTQVIAVGTAIAGRPPHRSVREELPHTALPLSYDGRDANITTCRVGTLA